jgi:hypothetical protein
LFVGQQVELMPGDLHVGSCTEHGYVATVPVALLDGLAVSVASTVFEAAANATFPGGLSSRRTSPHPCGVGRPRDQLSSIATDTMGYFVPGDRLATDSLSSGTYADPHACSSAAFSSAWVAAT